MPNSNSFDLGGNDDIYLASADENVDTTYYPEEDREQKEKAIETAGITAASYPIMPAIYAWFDEQAKECGNIHNVKTSSLTINGVKVSRTVSVEAQVFAYQLLEELLQDKASKFRSFVETLNEDEQLEEIKL